MHSRDVPTVSRKAAVVDRATHLPSLSVGQAPGEAPPGGQGAKKGWQPVLHAAFSMACVAELGERQFQEALASKKRKCLLKER